jgi:hypothetical protein
MSSVAGLRRAQESFGSVGDDEGSVMVELREIDDILERVIDEKDVDGSALIALAIRASGMQISDGLPVVAQSLGAIREEMLNQRLSRGQ